MDNPLLITNTNTNSLSRIDPYTHISLFQYIKDKIYIVLYKFKNLFIKNPHDMMIDLENNDIEYIDDIWSSENSPKLIE